MMISRINIASAAALALFLAACAGGNAIQGDESGGAGTTAGTTRSGADGQALGGDTQVAKAAHRPAKLRVLFEFDSNAIDSESRGIIEQHAAYLAANPDIKITLTGHADERGAREYNLALGERRGVSVERMLQVLGIQKGRVKTVSYGEEQPLAMSHDESSWRSNRRVEFVYKN